MFFDFFWMQDNTWNPPAMSYEDMLYECALNLPKDIESDGAYLFIRKTEPYIDAIYLHFTENEQGDSMYIKRFVFRDGYQWSYEDERFFTDRILNNSRVRHNCVINEIAQYYSNHYPDWKLKRYYTEPMRLLDHIYHCMRKGTAKEMLYKAGLDELAAHIDDLDEIELMASKPSDIYGGISMRALRGLNCREGSVLLSTAENREFVKELQRKYPVIFQEKLNDAQCKYLRYLIEGGLTVCEAGRLLQAKKKSLTLIWSLDQYQLFLQTEKMKREALRETEEIVKIDPLYQKYLEKFVDNDIYENHRKLHILRYYLLQHREEYDAKIRRSNRKRNPNWQERDKGYVVRYPQTTNDFCREAVYMCNCLLAYMDAYIENDTTILFMRKTDAVNAPFITIEIFQNEFTQAHHRFNEDCTMEETEWIRDYCDRHKIRCGKF